MQMLMLAVAIVPYPAVLVFEQLEQDRIAEVFVSELAAYQINESVFVPSGFEATLDMENEPPSLICLVLCALWPSHAGI